MKKHSVTAEKTIDTYGHALAARLERDAPELSYDISERLRAARMQAIAVRKPELTVATTSNVHISAGQATLTWGGEGGNLWNRLAAFVPLIALVLGLIAIQIIQSDSSVSEIAEVDSALLVDELPPGAYTDPGFVQFLKTNQPAQAETH